MANQALQNSAHILCIADAFLYPEQDKTSDLIKLFTKCGHKGIVIRLWSSKSIACFVRGGKHAKSNCWHVTFQQRANPGVLRLECSDVSSGSKTFAMIRTMILQRPTVWHPPEQTRRSFLDRDCRHAPPYNGTARLSSSTLSRTMRLVEHFQNPLRTLFSPTTPAMSRADLPFVIIGVFHIDPAISHGAAERHHAARH